MDIFTICIGVAQTLIMVWTLRVTLKPQAASAETQSPEAVPQGRFGYWPVIAMAVLAAVAWIPYFLRLNELDRVMAMTAWGATPDGCYVVMDGTKLQRYSEKYNLFLACGVSDPTIDQNQDTVISISSSFSVANGAIPIATKFPNLLLDHLKALSPPDKPQPISLWHTTFLFPKKADVSRVKRLADLREFGGKIVNNCEPIE